MRLIIDNSQVKRAARRLASVQGAFRRIGPQVEDKVQERFRAHQTRHFRSDGASTGARFVPLDAAYKQRKEDRFGPGLPILVASGRMLAAYRGLGPDAYQASSGLRVEVGVRGQVARYAKAHADGNPRRNLPVRPPVRYSTSANAFDNTDTLAGGIAFDVETWAEAELFIEIDKVTR